MSNDSTRGHAYKQCVVGGGCSTDPSSKSSHWLGSLVHCRPRPLGRAIHTKCRSIPGRKLDKQASSNTHTHPSRGRSTHRHKQQRWTVDSPSSWISWPSSSWISSTSWTSSSWNSWTSSYSGGRNGRSVGWTVDWEAHLQMAWPMSYLLLDLLALLLSLLGLLGSLLGGLLRFLGLLLLVLQLGGHNQVSNASNFIKAHQTNTSSEQQFDSPAKTRSMVGSAQIPIHGWGSGPFQSRGLLAPSPGPTPTPQRVPTSRHWWLLARKQDTCVDSPSS